MLTALGIQILIYMFLVEKTYIIRSSNKKPRLRSKLYIFNSVGMVGAYCVVVVPNFVLRIATIDNDECIIGMQRPAMIPLIVFDLVVNIYLTIIFLRPLSGLYSYKNVEHAPGSRRLKTMAVRTFVGCICTSTSSIVNLSVLAGLNGEPGWVCLVCCNSDILFSAIVIHWVIFRDDAPPGEAGFSSSGARGRAAEELGRISQHAAATVRSFNNQRRDSTMVENGTGSAGSVPISPRRKSHLTLTRTTEEALIIDNAAKISLANSDPPSTDCGGDTSPCCSSNAGNDTLPLSHEISTGHNGKRRLSIFTLVPSSTRQHHHYQHQHQEPDRSSPLRQPPPLFTSGNTRLRSSSHHSHHSHRSHHHRHPTKSKSKSSLSSSFSSAAVAAEVVRVDVDYGTSLSEAVPVGPPLGNKTTIEVGPSLPWGR
ncbi:hypothetical protein VTK26DRAFT_3078 [Humicola hyalothermophila]